MDASRELTQKFDIEPFSPDVSLGEMLELETPPFHPPEIAFRQIKYVEDYIRRADLSSNTARSVAIESHYVDRDFVFDYSVFFSRNLQPPQSHCRRVHFFAGESDVIKSKLQEIASLVYRGGDKSKDQYHLACKEFSRDYYLGFAVIRPLPACPVGRTVLRLLPCENSKDNCIREMSCTRKYRVHLTGITLEICGLAFQQQDLAVSRCATVALWCALQKIGDCEGIASATPAEIAGLASKNRLPFGRSMPSEGLALDQLCLAIESLGLSPYLVRVESLARGRSLIHAVTRSEMPAILIMQSVETKEWHATTVIGMKLHKEHRPCLTAQSGGDDLSGDLTALYIHDDRIGPYRRAEIDESESKQLRVKIKKQSHVRHEDGAREVWIVQYVLVPMHSKIRLSLNDLRTITQQWLIPKIQGVVALRRNLAIGKLPPVQFEHWIERGHSYAQRVLKENLLAENDAISFCQSTVMPRYVAVTRFVSDSFGSFDVLMDTTSPRPNHKWIAIVAHIGHESSELLHEIAEYIADLCQCSDRFFH